MSLHTTFLGNVYDWSEWESLLAVTFGMKQATKDKAEKMLSAHIAAYKLTPAEASKLRGLLQWADRGLTGRPCRGALTALTARQYYEKVRGHSLTPKLEEALGFLQTALQVMPDRKMLLGKEEEQPIVMSTDASTRKGGLILGILLMELGHKPI